RRLRQALAAELAKLGLSGLGAGPGRQDAQHAHRFRPADGEGALLVRGESTEAIAVSSLQARPSQGARWGEAEALSALGGDNTAADGALHHAGAGSNSAALLLRSYLMQGRLAPALRAAFAGNASGWLQAQLASQPVVWRSELAMLCLHPVALARLVSSFTEQTLHAVLALLSGGEHGGVKADAPWSACLLGTALQASAASLSMPDVQAWQRADVHGLTWEGGAWAVCVAERLASRDEPAERLASRDEPAARAWLRVWQQLVEGAEPSTAVLAEANAQSPMPSTATDAMGRLLTQPAMRSNLSSPVSGVFAEPEEVDNAGLLLLWPLLPGLFQRWGLVEQGRFIDDRAQARAVSYLDGWVWQDEGPAAWRTQLTQRLCGWPTDVPLPCWDPPDTNVLTSLDAILQGIAAQTPSLQRCGLLELRAWFLQRPGQWRERDGNGWLRVQPEGCDALLQELPWPMERIFLPWMQGPISVQWLNGIDGYYSGI
ncbi:MAG: hypothetical protein K2Q15_15130, partial [Burkholderiales bacterium]|nr:hypothetical protein [Burkholderiales bacterium]